MLLCSVKDCPLPVYHMVAVPDATVALFAFSSPRNFCGFLYEPLTKKSRMRFFASRLTITMASTKSAETVRDHHIARLLVEMMNQASYVCLNVKLGE